LPLSLFARSRTLVTGVWLWSIFGVMSWKQPEIWLYPGAFYEQASSYLKWGSPERAFQMLEMALRYDPDNPAYHVTQGYLALKLDRLDEAEERFRTSLRLRPADDEARLGLGQVMANKNKWLEAMDALNECTAPGLTPDQRLRRGKIYLQLNVSHLALADLQAALRRGDVTPEIVEEAWRVASEREEWRPNVELWARIAAVSSNDATRARALTRQARTLQSLGKPAEALAILETIPGDENLRLRAQLALEVKDDARSETLLRELHAQQAGDVWVEREFALVLHRLGKNEEASQIYGRVVSAAPQDDAARASYAWLLNVQGRYREAWKAAAGLRDWKQDLDLVRLRAKTAFWAGEHEAALDAYRQLTKSNPEDTEIQAELALVLTRLVNLEAAEALYRKLIESGDADAKVLEQYAWLLNNQQRYREAWDLIGGLETADAGTADPGTADPSRGGQNAAAGEGLRELQARTAMWAGEWRAATERFEELARSRSGDPEIWRALGEAYHRMANESEEAAAWQRYLALRPDDDQARLWLARSFSRSDSPQQAEAQYRALLASGRAAPEVVREAARWFESQGKLRDAMEQYLAAMRGSKKADPEIYLRLARLHRWTQQPGDAAAWYRAFLAESGDAPGEQALEARGEFAMALLETGRAEASLGEVRALLAQRPAEPAWLLLAARAASQQKLPKLTVEYLERLSGQRRLQPDERLWLAGQYRAAGQPREALALLEQIRGSGGGLGREHLEALADLRAEFGEPRQAIEVYQQLLEARRDPRLHIKLARVAGKIGPPELAASSFRKYLEVYPKDWEAQLSAARFFSSAGQFLEALAHYEPYLAQQGPGGAQQDPNNGNAGLALELAGVYLGAGKFDEGERWARQALEESTADPKARLALGQALHLKGQGDQADAVLGEIALERPEDPETLLWLGRAQMARNRHLAAYMSVEHAIRTGAKDPEYWMAQGDAARKRGDYGRSMNRYAAAETAGENPATIAAARQELAAETRSTAAPVASFSADSHGLHTRQAGAAWSFRPALALPLSLQTTLGEVSQRETSFSRRTVQVSSGTVLLKPQFGVNFAAGVERYQGGSSSTTGGVAATGRVEGRYFFQGGSEAGLRFSRESLWQGYDRRDPRNFNRIRDLSGIAPNFTLTGVQGNWTGVSRSNKQLQVNAGFDNYEDRNRRSYLYTHYQIPLTDAYGDWSVLAPNFYIETYKNESPYYFSPGRYMTGGVMYHSIRRFSEWTVEAEVNPRLVGYEDAVGLGAHAVFDVRKKVRGVEIGAGGFFAIEQRTGYKQWRFSGGVSIPLGGR
jgi:tetratricopeptide (TPR) repeat protein